MNNSQVFFATNRNPLKQAGKVRDYGERFNPEHPHELRFGCIEGSTGIVSSDTSPSKAIKKTIRNGLRISTYDERITKNGKSVKLGSTTMFQDVMAEMKMAVPTLVFIHGYANAFRTAAATALVFQELLRCDGVQINVVLFTWPSDGSNLYKAYFNDRQDASASGTAFARGFMKMNEFLQKIRPKEACRQPIHLLCHSMGNYVLEKTLRESGADCAGRLPRIFSEIILAAPDVDYDAFEYDHKLAKIPEIGRRVNVYFNRGDKALVISDCTKSNPDRLGHKGPRKPLDVPSGTVLLDCSEVVEEGLAGPEHGYFLDRRIRQDITEVLKGKREDTIGGRKYLASANTYVLSGI